MAQVFLFESGSTKTTLLVASNNTPRIELDDLTKSNFQEFALTGYNPNRPNSNFLNELAAIPIKPADTVYFYGSGLGSKKNKRVLFDSFKALFKIEIQVFDDLQGASRALYGQEAGIVAILGTGGITAYCDKGEIGSRIGGYGYLIDDIGGGYELGKQLVSAWLSDQLPAELNQEIESAVKIDRTNFVSNFYADPKLSNSKDGLDLIAGLVKLIPNYRNNLTVSKLLRNYFELFFTKNVIPLSQKYACYELRIVGSIGEIFKDIIHDIATKSGIELTNIMRFPALNLMAYHLTKKNLTAAYEN